MVFLNGNVFLQLSFFVYEVTLITSTPANVRFYRSLSTIGYDTNIDEDSVKDSPLMEYDTSNCTGILEQSWVNRLVNESFDKFGHLFIQNSAENNIITDYHNSETNTELLGSYNYSGSCSDKEAPIIAYDGLIEGNYYLVQTAQFQQKITEIICSTDDLTNEECKDSNFPLNYTPYCKTVRTPREMVVIDCRNNKLTSITRLLGIGCICTVD